MDTEDFVIDQGCQRQTIKHIIDVSEDIGVTVIAQALVVQAKVLTRDPTFMIASKQGDALGVPDLQSKQE